MKTNKTRLFGILLALMAGAAQSAWAQATAGTEDALLTLLKDGYTQVKLGQDITLTNGRLDIDGKTITLDLNGHTLTRQMTAADAGGQVIAVMNSGKLTVTDSSGSNSGTITGGWAYQGGAIYVYEGCSLTIEGGTITGNRADQISGGGYGFGGAVENHGTMTITGGNITGNTAGQFGGGIYNAKEATLTLTGGTVSGNQASTGGSGIYHEGFGGKLNMQGSPVVKDNTADDVRLAPGQIITVTGAFATGASIGVAASVPGIFTTGYGTYNPDAAPSTYFFLSPQTTGFVVTSREGEASIVQAYKYIERAWDDTEKKVTEEEKSCTNYTPINGTDTSDKGWLPLNDGWYVVTGNSAYKVLNILGTDVHLILPDGVTLTVTGGVKLEEGHQLSIYGQSGNASGTLIATNSYENGAGIGGGGEGLKAGALVVHGGIIQAKGNLDGAGIGGGYKAGFGTTSLSGLTVYGGSVTAEGDKAGAGIGSGRKCEDFAGYVMIYGGTVTATGGGSILAQEQADSSWSGAGIGGGDDSKGAIVHIYGGTVTATSGGVSDNYRRAAGIGGGFRSSGEQTNIHGGIVTAISKYGAGIGGGYGDDANGGYITIEGGTVNATSYYGAGIGTGCESEWAKIIITGGNVSATSTEGAGIGGGRSADATAQISISGGTVVATGTTAIGSGGSREGELLSFKGTINISGGKVYATGNNDRRPGQCRALGGANYELCAANTTLPDDFMVKAGDSAEEAKLFDASQRLAACLTRYYAAIEPCTHPEAGIFFDNGTTHYSTCHYCLTNADAFIEAHTFNSDGECKCGLLGLNDAADNAAILAKWNEWARPVALSGRTLYKDGSWNTLCLPFSLSSLTGTPLEEATVKTLESASFDNGTLTLNFSENSLESIEAGKPYIVMWTKEAGYVDDDAHNIVNPMFRDVTISNTTADVTTDEVTFRGIFSPFAISGEDRSLLYLDADNTLRYPNAAMTIGAFRAYFELAEGITAGDPASGIRTFVLNFDGEETGIREINASNPSNPSTPSNASNSWFTLDGQRLSGQPEHGGLYLHKGRKVLIK